MKLIRFGPKGKELPGIKIDDSTSIDVSAFINDYNESFFENNDLEKLKKWLSINIDSCPKISNKTRLGPPLVRPSKIICVGLNYSKHANESGMAVPKEPVLFFKSTTSIIGPYDDVIIPKNSDKTDWEVELALVIGKKASYIDAGQVKDHIFGYVLHNDISERSFQLEREGQWVKGKSCDTFAPLGPYLVTKDEIKNANNLNLWLKLNGEIMQKSNTSDFIFKINEVVSYISQFMTLLPGDIISTGTPSGVGLGFDPPKFLKNNDIMELSVEGLGVSKQKVKSYKNDN
jgi:2-keto-4-pentenoate hydratase/2-oxohepta-3-ene-1,7-dioic acid hydratase in catechol pathway|tara:strand:- start:495 stop:1358 length:864 start_codon:yes stop_codon:yes gene_type:complete